ncbi:hypothetical protein H6G59_17110 [Anabaena lutea FACHB-196]|uniref:Uncharacterized protein n=1 Tax=Anabaena lutea FACHB-196 TaxID=2692881 RepID=A0ABR8FI76_9NOST|nr:hypothetical protein [Anabaena lutea FACHB-196]
MGRWGDGEMGRWGDGEMGRWGDGGTRRWGDARKINNYLFPVPCSLFPVYELRINSRVE